LLGAANGRKLFLKIHVKIQTVQFHMCLRAKNKALQLQRVPILSILGYITLTYSLNRLSSLKFPKPKMKGRQI